MDGTLSAASGMPEALLLRCMQFSSGARSAAAITDARNRWQDSLCGSHGRNLCRSGICKVIAGSTVFEDGPGAKKDEGVEMPAVGDYGSTEFFGWAESPGSNA